MGKYGLQLGISHIQGYGLPTAKCNPKAENSYQRNMLALKCVQVQLIPKQMISGALVDS